MKANRKARKEKRDGKVEKAVQKENMIPSGEDLVDTFGLKNGTLAGSAAFIGSGGKEIGADIIAQAKDFAKSGNANLNISAAGIGEGIAATGSLAKGIAGELLTNAQGMEVSKTLTMIYNTSENARMQLMSEMKDALDATKEATRGSQTAQAIGESVSDVKNFVTGGTTNITMPVSPHDIDRGTNLLYNQNSS